MKKVLIIIMALLVTIIGCIPVHGEGYIEGDMDHNGSVDAGDALMALQYAVGKITFPDDLLWVADVSRDPKSGDAYTVDAEDALLILQKAVGIVEHFPSERRYAA